MTDKPTPINPAPINPSPINPSPINPSPPQTDITIPIGTPVFDYLENRCKENKLSMVAICEIAEVHTSKIWRWKHSEPIAFETLRKMNAAINAAINADKSDKK